MKNVVVMLSLVLVVSACKQRENASSESAGTQASRGATTSAAPAATATGIDVGSRLPEYSAMWLDGSKFALESRRDKVVLVNIWATWCGPCVFEIPELQALHDKYAPRKFEVIGVSVDESGVEAVKQFAQEHKMTYPVVIDPDGNLANMLQTNALPTTVLLGRDGKILWKHLGQIRNNDPELAKAIETAL
jgi:thiol-disulfide isomerase/thioredoxin